MRTPISAIDSIPAVRAQQQGFSLLELMVVFAIMGLFVGLGVPMAGRMYDTMQYRDGVRQISAAVLAARYRAVSSGAPVDLLLVTDPAAYTVQPAGNAPAREQFKALSDSLRVAVVSAQEVSPGDGVAAIRFYPEGGSTGGSVSLLRSNGSGVRLRVDWLLGRVTQESVLP